MTMPKKYQMYRFLSTVFIGTLFENCDGVNSYWLGQNCMNHYFGTLPTLSYRKEPPTSNGETLSVSPIPEQPMNFRTLVMVGLVGVGMASGFAVELQDTKTVFSGKSEICLSDGSSLYIFHPNGAFSLEPMGCSGRTIEGKWSYDSNDIHISGIWSWINGYSIKNDQRQMDLHIGYIGSKKTEYQSLNTGKIHNIQESYFYIDRLEKEKSTYTLSPIPQ